MVCVIWAKTSNSDVRLENFMIYVIWAKTSDNDVQFPVR